MAVALNPTDANSWWSWVTNYDQTLANFSAQYNALVSQSDYVSSAHPELSGQYSDLLSRANSALSTLNGLKATRDYVYSWLNWLQSGAQAGVDFIETGAQSVYDAAKAVLGLSGVERRVGRTLHGLGIVPMVVIGLAAAGAALIVIGYWIKDAYAFNQRLSALQTQEANLQASGMTADQAASRAQQIVDGTLGPAPGSAGAIDSNILGIPWTWLITGAIVVFLGPPIIEAITGREVRHVA